MLTSVNENSGPPPIPDAPVAANPIVLPLTELGKPPGSWTLTLHPAHLALAEAAEAHPYVILREQVMKTANLIEGMRAFVVEKPRKLTFKLTPEGTKALAEWIGIPLLAAHYLKRRYSWVLPVAAIWMMGSLPLGVETPGGQAVPFDPVGFGLGLTLVVAWIFAKWRPHPVLFLVDSVWFLVMGGHLVMSVVNGRSKGWLVLVALLVWMAVNGFRHFIRFRKVTIARLRE